MPDSVNHPAHYGGFSNGAEVIDITENLNFNLGNVVKYVARAGRKTVDPVEDLRKAQWYLERELARIGSVSPVENVPRVWNLLDDILPDVVVVDVNGLRWRRIGGTGKFLVEKMFGQWGEPNPATMRQVSDAGPFTEVLA